MHKLRAFVSICIASTSSVSGTHAYVNKVSKSITVQNIKQALGQIFNKMYEHFSLRVNFMLYLTQKKV